MSPEAQILQSQPSAPDDRLVHVAVIGGGISGLAAAHRAIELAKEASKSVRVELFEVSSRLGGVIQTEQIDGCIAELGADSFITNKPAVLELCRRLDLEGRLIATDPAHRQGPGLGGGKAGAVPGGFP